MAAIAQFHLDIDTIPLGSFFERFPESTVELERVVPMEERAIQYVWVTGARGADFEATLEREEGVRRSHVVDEFADRALVRISWEPGVNGFAQSVLDAEVTLLSAVGSTDGWAVEVRGDDYDAISRFDSRCDALGVDAELTSLHGLLPATERTELVTEPQRAALLLAYERGYYDTPRTATLDSLADELDISRQAVAARLKRGTRRLVEGVLAE